MLLIGGGCILARSNVVGTSALELERVEGGEEHVLQSSGVLLSAILCILEESCGNALPVERECP